MVDISPTMANPITNTESVGAYQVSHARLSEVARANLADWKMRDIHYDNNILHGDPEWLLEQFKGEEEKLHVFLVKMGGDFLGAVPFELSQRPLKCQLGEFQVVEFPLRRLRLLGYSLSLPADGCLYDLVFSKILETAGEFDAIFMEYLKVDSYLWSYLRTSPLISQHFRYYSRQGPLPHPLLRFKGSFDEYLQKFSAKTRKNRVREVKRLRDEGGVEFICVTQPDEVEDFLDTAAAISRKTWQFNMVGWGLAAWDLTQIKRRLKFAAERGWLRSYLLKCGGTPCSFILGLQHSHRFYHAVVGYDPQWSRLSVGSVLQFLVLEDLFGHNRPEVYDFGTYAPYKEYWANESYLELSGFLFPRRPYLVLVEIVHRACSRTSIQAAAILDRLHLKPSVRRVLRRIRGGGGKA